MCGVVGYCSERVTPGDVDLICRIFEHSRIRGLHSCGFSFFDAGIIKTRKFFDTDELKDSVRRVASDLIGGSLSLIGHTRYSTSGDWENHLNNQPLHIVGSGRHEISLAFNGCIHMGLRAEYEKRYGRQYTTDNDGEIFCRKVLDGEDWAAFVTDGHFSFSGAFLFKDSMHAIRNKNRPLWIGTIDHSRFLASTEDIFKRSGFQGLVSEVEACKAFRIG